MGIGPRRSPSHCRLPASCTALYRCREMCIGHPGPLPAPPTQSQSPPSTVPRVGRGDSLEIKARPHAAVLGRRESLPRNHGRHGRWRAAWTKVRGGPGGALS